MTRFTAVLFLSALCLLGIRTSSTAQVTVPSIHQVESEQHRHDPVRMRPAGAAAPVSPLAPRTTALTKKVFGYHPYWVSSSAYLAYDYAALTTIGYFDYEVNTATGAYTTMNDWSWTPLISYAHERGVKVVIVVTNFGADANTAILSDTVKQSTMISTLITLLTARSGDGVNIDFEGVPAAQRANLVSFMRTLATRVRAVIPGAEISMAAPAVDWSNAWDLAALGGICDYLVIMGYDYYWSGSSTAGPVSPLEGENYNVTRTITTYLGAGVQAQKIVLGLAWYGYDWPVTSAARKATATGTASSATYAVLEPKAKSSGKQFDASTKTPWFSYQSGSVWHQAWYDDSLSLSYKYALVNAKNLAGIGMWALGSQGTSPVLWQGIQAGFKATSVATEPPVPQQYTLAQNYPNPFNPSTRIAYTMPSRGYVAVRVFDVLGKEVMTLVDGVMDAGSHSVEMDASRLPSGVYFCRMQAGAFTETKKLALVR